LKLYTNLPDKTTAKIAGETSLEIATNPKSSDTINIIIRTKNMDDPTELIYHPKNCIIIAGTPSEAVLAFSEKAEQAGVPPENIYLMPINNGIPIKTLSQKISELQSRLMANQTTQVQEEENDIIYLDDEETPTNKVKVITVRGYRGGVGTTTIVASLAAILHDNGGKVAILDLGIPPNIKNYSEKPKFEKKDGFKVAVCECWDLYQPLVPAWQTEPGNVVALLENLRKEYRWVVVDFSPQPDKEHIAAIKPDKIVIVMDSDIIQSVEPAAKTDATFIYNKVMPDIELDLIKGILGQPVILIKSDYEGCYAALASGSPANRKSEDIAVAMGKLAAKIQ